LAADRYSLSTWLLEEWSGFIWFSCEDAIARVIREKWICSGILFGVSEE
jgi:hypothetical protein